MSEHPCLSLYYAQQLRNRMNLDVHRKVNDDRKENVGQRHSGFYSAARRNEIGKVARKWMQPVITCTKQNVPDPER